MRTLNPIRLMLVDDHELIRHGIRRLLEGESELVVVAEAGSGEEAVRLAKRSKPDVVLMDVVMPGMGGLEATRKLVNANAEVRVIALSMKKDDLVPAQLLAAGAMGYLYKGAKADEMLRAIKEVVAGRRYLSPEIAQILALSRLPNGAQSPFDNLSQRELQVVMMVVEGHRPSEISERLCVSPKTVSTHRSRLFQKLGVANDVELMHLAIRHGMLSGEG